MIATLFGAPPGEDNRVYELHCWIAIYPDGREGIMSADMDLAMGVRRHAPLLSSKREVTERLGEIARLAQEKSVAAGQPVKIVLRSFVAIN